MPQRKGTGAFILIALVVLGAGYVVSQNPEIVDQLESATNIQLPEGGDGLDGGECSAAQEQVASKGHTPQGCLCVEERASDDVKTTTSIMVGVEDGYITVFHTTRPDGGDSWRVFDGGVESKVEAQASCDLWRG